MIEIKRYTSADKGDWDDFVHRSINSLFMFRRDYMDYHKDRFFDHSLMLYRNKRLEALLPANEDLATQSLISHQGLTFGSFLITRDMGLSKLLDIFSTTGAYLKTKDFKTLIYKAIPHIYSSMPAEADLYALFQMQAKLLKIEPSTCINLNCPGRTRHRDSRAREHGLTFKASDDYQGFWTILEAVLKNRHDAEPTHTYEEITMLSSKFPENIQLFIVEDKGEMLAGAVLYLYERLVHTQYLASNPKGYELGAMDLLLAELIKKYTGRVEYFDFGISTENNGVDLNEGLVRFKERHGGSTIVHETWAWDLNS